MAATTYQFRQSYSLSEVSSMCGVFRTLTLPTLSSSSSFLLHCMFDGTFAYQAANCGIGIVGKEGRQASLAADYSVTEFRRVHRLLFWHGRLSYQRSAKLAQFVIHRGLSIAIIQVGEHAAGKTKTCRSGRACVCAGPSFACVCATRLRICRPLDIVISCFNFIRRYILCNLVFHYQVIFSSLFYFIPLAIFQVSAQQQRPVPSSSLLHR
eukprot:284818757_6